MCTSFAVVYNNKKNEECVYLQVSEVLKNKIFTK